MPFAVAVGKPFQAKFGVPRSGQYTLIQRDHVESFVVGDGRGRRFILVDSYLAYVRRQRERDALLRADNSGQLGLRR